MSLIKIHGGTPSGRDLCISCKYLEHVKGHALTHELRYCNSLNTHLRWPVSSCNRYKEHRNVEIAGALYLDFDAEDDALIVKTGEFGAGKTVEDYLHQRRKTKRV